MMKGSTHSTASAPCSQDIKPIRNYFPPTTSTNTADAEMSHFPHATSTFRKHYFTATGIIVFWTVVLVWCSPRYVAYGLPLVMMTEDDPHSVQDVILDFRGEYVSPQRWWHLHEKTNKPDREVVGDDKNDSVQDWNYEDNEQEITGSVRPNESIREEAVLEPPRKKKGLSYLTKYYSEAFLNNTPHSVNGGSSSASSSRQSHHDSSSRFFGDNVGINSSSSSASGEQRFPSSVRRKLSFYPSMTSHSVFMSPWSRSGTGFTSGGIKFAVKLVEETKSFKEINGRMLPVPFPGCEKPTFKSDAYWECVARHTTATAYKYCATVPMGKDSNDPVAVVDSFLRVFGTKGLRVVDGSVFQEKEVSVNQCTCQMLGSLASEFILDYWDNQKSGLEDKSSSSSSSSSNEDGNSIDDK